MNSPSPHVHLEETTPWVRRWLRAEGLAGLAVGWVAWQAQGGEPVWFVPLLLAPDISMAVGLGWWLAAPALTMTGAILVAHTGIDRLPGYGLKYPTSFQDTHLGRIGRPRPAPPG